MSPSGSPGGTGKTRQPYREGELGPPWGWGIWADADFMSPKIYIIQGALLHKATQKYEKKLRTKEDLYFEWGNKSQPITNNKNISKIFVLKKDKNPTDITKSIKINVILKIHCLPHLDDILIPTFLAEFWSPLPISTTLVKSFLQKTEIVSIFFHSWPNFDFLGGGLISNVSFSSAPHYW